MGAVLGAITGQGQRLVAPFVRKFARSLALWVGVEYAGSTRFIDRAAILRGSLSLSLSRGAIEILMHCFSKTGARESSASYLLKNYSVVWIRLPPYPAHPAYPGGCFYCSVRARVLTPWPPPPLPPGVRTHARPISG